MKNIIGRNQYRNIINNFTNNISNQSFPSYNQFVRNSSSDSKKPVNYNVLLDNKEATQEFITNFNKNIKKDQQINFIPEKPKVFKVEDIIEKENSDYEYGHLIFACQDQDAKIRYSENTGKPKNEEEVKNLLDKELILPKDKLLCLNIKQHIPFNIESEKDYISSNMATNNSVFLENVDSKKNYKFSCLNQSPLPQDVTELLSSMLRNKLYLSDFHSMDKFFEENIFSILPPTENLNTSTTLMHFSEGERKNTPSHYHPGKRYLMIFTTNAKAGAELNFCGIDEDPNDRPDMKVKIKFPQNSICLLEFPAFTHHKFYGDFLALSYHPQEGKMIVDSVIDGKNNLELATKMSKTKVISPRKKLGKFTAKEISKELQKQKNDKTI